MSSVRSVMAAAFLLTAGVLPTAAQGLIVDTADVDGARQAGALIWDVRNEGEYAKGHIPGAVNVGSVADVFRDANREDPPPAAEAARIFGAAGMNILGRDVIVYARKGDPFAYYGARMIEYYGGRHARVYHGGIDDWTTAGKPISTDPVKLPAISLALTTEGQGALLTKDLIDRARAGGVQILDARTPKEFTGEDIRAIRGGHVPGAVNIPYEQNWIDPATGAKLAARQVTSRDGMALKPEADLRALYGKLDPNKETVVYCQSAVRASHTAAVLRSIGFTNVRVYESSWLGYAATLSAPVADEVFVNIGTMRQTIAALQSRVSELEAELAKLRGTALPR